MSEYFNSESNNLQNVSRIHSISGAYQSTVISTLNEMSITNILEVEYDLLASESRIAKLDTIPSLPPTERQRIQKSMNKLKEILSSK